MTDFVRAALLVGGYVAVLVYFLGSHDAPQAHGSGAVISSGRASCYVIQGQPYARGAMTCPSGVVVAK